MRAVSGWARMMRQTLTVAPRTGRDVYDKPTFGTPVSFRCRLVGRRLLVRTAENKEVVSNWTAYLMTNEVIAPDSQVTLSTGDVGSTEEFAIHPPILATGRFPDDSGGYHHSTIHW